MWPYPQSACTPPDDCALLPLPQLPEEEWLAVQREYDDCIGVYHLGRRRRPGSLPRRSADEAMLSMSHHSLGHEHPCGKSCTTLSDMTRSANWPGLRM